jgi:hypothetical protein
VTAAVTVGDSSNFLAVSCVTVRNPPESLPAWRRASARRLLFHVSHGGEVRTMMFDDSWYGMRRHRGERGVFIPGEGFRAAPLPPWVPPAPPQLLVPPVLAGSPEAAGEPQSAENVLADTSNLSPPERPHVKPIERFAGPVELKEVVFKPGPNWSKRGAAQGFLRWILANGEVAATEIFRRGKDAGISPKALKKAQKVCGIRPVQRRRSWWWSMPPPRRVR